MRYVPFLVVALLTISGCQTIRPQASTPRISLPPPPSDIVACFGEAGVILPPAGDWTGNQAGAVIGALVAHEGKLTECGVDFLAWYNKVRTSYGAIK